MKKRKMIMFAEAVFYTAFLSFAVGSAAYSGYSTGALQPVVEIEGTEEESDQTDDGEEGDEPSFQLFEATAYCDFGITYSGVLVNRGIVAADPRILPIGSVIEIKAGKYSGIYTVMDTGGVVKGEIIDIYMPEYEEAIQFGRQKVGLRVLRKGWNPVLPGNPEFVIDPGMAIAG